MKKLLKNTAFFACLCLGISVNGQTYNMTNSVVTTCAGNFYDNAGSAANYSVSLNLTETFTAPTVNYRMKVSFSAFSTELGYDTLSVYDGTSTAVAFFKNKFSGTSIPPNQYSSNQSLTFHFVSDAATVNPGWTASVTCFGISNITPTTASQSKAITITVNGSNTTFSTAPVANNVFLVHTVSTATITGSAPSIVNNLQLTSNFNIPCNADLGMYDLYVDQPGVGLTKLANAFNVTSYQLNLTPTSPSCFGLCNGSISAIGVGGTPAYSYYWQPGSMVTQNVSGLCAGMYTCTITDGIGCQRIQTVALTQPSLLNATASVTNAVCFGTSTGACSATPTGGTPAYTYNWSPIGGTAPVASGLSAGNYTCTITDANACVKTISVSVTQPSALTVNAGSDQTICSGSMATLNTSTGGGVPSYTFLWTPAVGLSSTTTASTNCMATATTVYTITVTDVNGCTANDNVMVTVNPLPVVAATSNTPCVGDDIIFNNTSNISSGSITAYSWSGPNSFSSTLVNPSITNSNLSMSGNYSLTAVSNGGCISSLAFSVTVNPTPTITIAPSVTGICIGGTSTLSASGATTYNWSTSQVTASILVTPTLTTTYSLAGTNPLGCTGTASVTISVMSNKSLTGSIFNETAGNVVLYKYSSILSQWDSLTITPISSSSYVFNNLDSGQYVVKAIPATPTNQITYGTSFISWQDATIINHGCTVSLPNDITVVSLTSIGTGTGSISGTIIEADGFGQRSSDFKPMAPGNPIGGIVVKGGRNPGGQMFAQTTTDPVTGTYTLSNVPDGVNYFILVDIPGLDTNLTYHFNLTPGNNQLTGLDFTVDSMFVNPVMNVTSVHDVNVEEHQLVIYPNPTSNQLNINYTLQVNSSVSIELFDMVGRSVKTLLPLTTQTADKYKNSFQLAELNSGMYFIKLKINNTESTVKLFVTN